MTYTSIITLIITCMINSFVSAAQPSNSDIETVFAQQLQVNKGRVVYVDFWSSWCIPCRKSFPWMNDLQNKYQKQGLTIIGINVDHDRKLADEFLAENPAVFSIIYDPKGHIARKYKLKGMPSSFIINKAGNIVSTHVGFNEKKAILYEKELINLLNE